MHFLGFVLGNEEIPIPAALDSYPVAAEARMKKGLGGAEREAYSEAAVLVGVATLPSRSKENRSQSFWRPRGRDM